MNYLGARHRRLRDCAIIDRKLSSFNRVHGCPYVIDTYSTYYPINLIDTNDATAWVSATVMSGVSKPWMFLDLGSPQAIAKVRVNQSSGVDYCTQFKIEISDDNITYALVHTTAAGLGAGEYLWYPPLLRARYWKSTVIAGPGYGWNVNSYELFGLIS